jgi:carboxymethylenebutenolidase
MDIVLPPSGRGPGVVVLHPWWGLNATIRVYGAALAQQGFVVGLPDLFDGAIADTIDGAETLLHKNFETGTEKARAAIVELSGHPALTDKSVKIRQRRRLLLRRLPSAASAT